MAAPHAVYVSVALALSSAVALSEVTLVGAGSVPGDARDLSGLTDTLSGGVPHDRFGGFGSAVAWMGEGWRFLVLSDRGPSDGATTFRDRFHEVDLGVDPEAHTVGVSLLRTVLLTDESGLPLTGDRGAFVLGEPGAGLRYDPEGIRVGRGGEVFISDEYGPAVDVFSPGGRRLRRMVVPPAFRVSAQSAAPEGELPPHNTSGRQPNRGFEGVALSPDGATVSAILQSPLIQDGALDARNRRVGLNIRVLVIDAAGGGSRQFVYPLQSPRYGVSEILAVGGGRFLVLERDGEAGSKARAKLVYLADFSSASDVSAVDSLPTGALPPGVNPVSKRLFLDLLDPAHGLAGDRLPEKIEGLTFGPDLADGRRTLVVTSDNDFKVDEPTYFWVFAFTDADLAPPGASTAPLP